MRKIERAIVSVHNKERVVDFARVLREFGIEIFSTEGTRNALLKGGVEAKEIADLTGVREILNGRVKTLHPRVHAGLLGVPGNKLHEEEMRTYECQWLDMVVVNLQPLDQLLARPNIALDEVMDEVDIGGVAMVRSAAKNFRYVSVVTNPERYSTLIHELRAHEGSLPFVTRFRLAQEAFALTAQYDGILAEYLRKSEPPDE